MTNRDLLQLADAVLEREYARDVARRKFDDQERELAVARARLAAAQQAAPPAEATPLEIRLVRR